MKIKPYLKMALITMAAIYGANYLSSMNTTARKMFKGSPVIGLPSTSSTPSTATAANSSPWWSI